MIGVLPRNNSSEAVKVVITRPSSEYVNSLPEILSSAIKLITGV